MELLLLFVLEVDVVVFVFVVVVLVDGDSNGDISEESAALLVVTVPSLLVEWKLFKFISTSPSDGLNDLDLIVFIQDNHLYTHTGGWG